ncbi:Alpha/Beta hydrolase protein [Aspergillus pseudocaelatus]|uniref:Alpha/Beta hydrolase protein n=1 Tax=Aspergillus pseudocaelatus TaxID=1825620 RepID=A0ABQ6WDN4_9EURO|nr:Alpha/Beta hydrolase protein [Aspergillus pseudocaelatus]
MIVARQSTSWPGEGRMKELADHIKQQLPSSDSETLQYPAYGDIWRYRSSVFTGDKAMLAAINTYTSRCPDSKIVLLGYSQGAHIIGDILCGSIVERGFPAIPPIDGYLVKGLLLRFQWGILHLCQVFRMTSGQARTLGFDYPLRAKTTTNMQGQKFLRINNTVCTGYDSIRRSYCDDGDIYCAPGFWFGVHRRYVARYKDDATRFVLSRVNTTMQQW